jgi:hypothetical protein
VADRALEIQKAVVARLKAHSGVAALIAGRVYDRAPEGVAFPYVSIGPAFVTPFDAQAMRGTEVVLQLDVWSRKPGAVECRQIMAAINAALHWHDLALDAGKAVLCRASSRRNMPDPDGVTTHGVVELSILTDG